MVSSMVKMRSPQNSTTLMQGAARASPLSHERLRPKSKQVTASGLDEGTFYCKADTKFLDDTLDGRSPLKVHARMSDTMSKDATGTKKSKKVLGNVMITSKSKMAIDSKSDFDVSPKKFTIQDHQIEVKGQDPIIDQSAEP